MDLSATNVIGLIAGTLVVAVGVFVLAARPHSGLHRLFFLLTFADGVSTILSRLSFVVDAPQLAAYFRGTYWYFFLLFVALLAVFGVLFPRPLLRRGATPAMLALVGVAFASVTALYVLRHDLFWSVTVVGGRASFPTEPMGNGVAIVWMLATAFIAGRLTHLVLRDGSDSHRRQAAFVLGGMTLAYAPYAATVTAQALFDARGTFLESRPDRVLAYWAYATFCVGLLASAFFLWRERRPEGAAERRFVLGCYAGVLALAIGAALFPTPAIAALLRMVALLAYPTLLGYAIARYEVFDIDRRLRRAATVTLSAVALTVAFVLVENAAENALQQRVFGGIPSQWVAGSGAAIITAFVFVPVARASRKAAARLVPELSHDEIHQRKLEIYRHSLAGALADGILREGESRTLAALRSSLGITDSDHARILSEVVA